MEKRIDRFLSFLICVILSLSVICFCPRTVAALSDSPDWTGAFETNSTVQYGESVVAAGDVNNDGYADVIVSAPGARAVLAYYGSSSGLGTTADWAVTDDQSYSGFGDAIAAAGDVNQDGYSDIIISASYYDNGEFNEGKVFAYYGSASGFSATADWTLEPDQVHMYFGASVACAGDVNGDGYPDIVVGATGYGNEEILEGQVCVYYGSGSGLSTVADWAVESNEDYAGWGRYVASAGDVNGDGCSDIIVGQPGYDNGESNEGRVLLYYGSPSGPGSVADWSAESDQAQAYFGESAATAGDVNDDGYSDIVVSSRSGYYTYDTGDGEESSWTGFNVSVYYGSANGPGSSADWTAENDHGSGGDSSSISPVSAAGDVNGDGYSDIIVGDPSYDIDGKNYGKVYVYYGSASGLGATAGWSAESEQINSRFGISVSGAGDVNNDGYWDIIIGAPGESGDVAEIPGEAFLYYGTASGDSDDGGNDTGDNDGDGDGGGCFITTALSDS